MKIAFEQQRLPPNLIAEAIAKHQLGQQVSGPELLAAVESSGGSLPEELRGLLASASIPAAKHRGRPPKNPIQSAIEDFAFEELEAILCSLVQKYAEKNSSSKMDGSPTERAYRELAHRMNGDFGNIDGRALANKHSAWRNGRYHSREALIDSDDFDAEIDRLFPALK
jgi:hypothetical protein